MRRTLETKSSRQLGIKLSLMESPSTAPPSGLLMLERLALLLALSERAVSTAAVAFSSSSVLAGLGVRAGERESLRAGA